MSIVNIFILNGWDEKFNIIEYLIMIGVLLTYNLMMISNDKDLEKLEEQYHKFLEEK